MQETIVTILLTIMTSVFASSGLWAFISSKRNSKDASHAMLIGLAHDRIIFLGSEYIKRGYITIDEYENLNDYLFKPYKAMGGNGSAERIMNEVAKLPIK